MGDFLKSLWPSQNVWTLSIDRAFMLIQIFQPAGTGKSLSKALLFAEHQESIYWTCNSMINQYFGSVDAKIRASDKDLSVPAESTWMHDL